MIYDAIIIGAGPAGSTAATFLAEQGRSVLLLEQGRFPRHKLCGEFITPECLNVFERLGVRDHLFEAGAQTIRQWTMFAPDGRGIEVPMAWIAGGHTHAIGLTRARMDMILLERAREAGVEVRQGFHVSSRLARLVQLGQPERSHHEGETSVIEGTADGVTIEQFSARLVIDASGRNGVFSQQTTQDASRFEGSRLFACKVHLRAIEGLREIGELFFFRNGYGGISDVEGGRTNLCFLTTEATLREAKGDRARLLDLTVRSNPAARRRLRDAVIDGEWLGTGPITYGRRWQAPGVLSIGDARAFIDPFTGSGILLALMSGELAAHVVHQALDESIVNVEAIAARYSLLHRQQFGLRFRACAILRGIAFQPFARNAIVSLLSRHRTIMRLIAISTRQ